MHLHLERYMWAQTLKIGVYACIQSKHINISYNPHDWRESNSSLGRILSANYHSQKQLALLNFRGFVDVLRVCSGLWI